MAAAWSLLHISAAADACQAHTNPGSMYVRAPGTAALQASGTPVGSLNVTLRTGELDRFAAAEVVAMEIICVDGLFLC